MDLELTDKVALITGSSHGLGLASALALVQEGCRVAICARGEARLGEAASALRQAAGSDDRVLSVLADVSTAAGIEKVVTKTVSTFGGVDILVNNVGLGGGSTIVDTPDEQWHEAIDQTLFPAIRASRLAVCQSDLYDKALIDLRRRKSCEALNAEFSRDLEGKTHG